MLKKAGTVREEDWGYLDFAFADATGFGIAWESFGESFGGEFSEDTIDYNTTSYTPTEIVRLAYANTGRHKPEIVWPE